MPDAVRFDFRPGQVDGAALPIADLQSAWQRAVGRLREHANDFDPLGDAKLRARDRARSSPDAASRGTPTTCW